MIDTPVPKADLTVIDDWHVMGLRGTGSKSVVAKDIFAPSYRAFTWRSAGGGAAPASGRAAEP